LKPPDLLLLVSFLARADRENSMTTESQNRKPNFAFYLGKGNANPDWAAMGASMKVLRKLLALVRQL